MRARTPLNIFLSLLSHALGVQGGGCNINIPVRDTAVYSVIKSIITLTQTLAVMLLLVLCVFFFCSPTFYE